LRSIPRKSLVLVPGVSETLVSRGIWKDRKEGDSIFTCLQIKKGKQDGTAQTRLARTEPRKEDKSEQPKRVHYSEIPKAEDSADFL